MSLPGGSERERDEARALLARLLDGELGPEDAQVQELLLQHPGLREELSAMAQTAGRLDELAAERGQAIEDARHETGPQDRAQARKAAVQAGFPEASTHSGSEAPHSPALDPKAPEQAPALQPRTFPPTWLRWTAAAAAVLALGFFLQQDPAGSRVPAGPAGMLNSELAESPVGSVPSFELFRLALPKGDATDVTWTVYDPAGTALFPSVQTQSIEWRPTPEQLSILEAQSSIRWTFEAKQELIVRTGSASASLAQD